MDTTSYLTAAVATAQIDSRIREARKYRLAKDARQTPDTPRPEICCPPTRRVWILRRATA